MPEVILRLETDPETGEKRVVVDYQSDRDALPMEHEDDHRDIVDQLLEHAEGAVVTRAPEGSHGKVAPSQRVAQRDAISEGGEG